LEMLQHLAGTSVPVLALRNHLGKMGLPGLLALQPIYTMSGQSVSQSVSQLSSLNQPANSCSRDCRKPTKCSPCDEHYQ